ncbi:MAG TPA: hypothetical protein VL200_16625 [Lacunisphaera sp.]|jgi:hypothetical protein|nr:hypothetical protein [Lacunisphaera sp.]
MRRSLSSFTLAPVAAACLLLPPLGAWLAGRPLRQFFRFPPPLDIPAYPKFSWWAIGLTALGIALLLVPWLVRRRPDSAAPAVARPARPFPWWGWLGIGWTAAWWILAWTRFPWFAWAQRFTFTPLWLGFIIVVNALTWRRRGSCLLVNEPRRLVRLFSASAAFWWGFEYLNRFVRNWHYLGVEDFGAIAYAANASVCFSTVLPAVASVREWLGGFPRLQRALASGPPWRWLDRRGPGPILVLLGAVGLVATGAQPLYFYPALWVAPLLLAVGLARVRGEPGWWNDIAVGDWHEAASWMLAAPVCGLCWEMWNYHSLAQWIYTVPFAQRWQVFEMPLAGYAGYVAFGLECAIAAAWCGKVSSER